jgi:hypothetical protein
MEFFDDLNKSRRSRALQVTVFVVILPLLALGAWYSGHLLRFGGPFAVIVCWCFLFCVAASIPRQIHDLAAAAHGEPAFRLSAQGIWSRDWSSFGWIEFADIESVCISWLRHYPKNRDLVLKLRDRNKYMRRLHWLDRISLMTVGLISRIAGKDDKSVLLASSSALGSAWDSMMAALDPLLISHGVPKQLREIDPGQDGPS